MEYLHTDLTSGLQYYSSEEPVTGKTIVRTEQDCQPVLDWCAEQRAEGMRDKGIPGGGMMKKYADVPLSIFLIMKEKHGINMFRPDATDWKKFFYVMETEYPMFKTTEMKAWRPK